MEARQATRTGTERLRPVTAMAGGCATPARFEPRRQRAFYSSLMGEHVGNDRIHGIRLAVNDDHVLAPDEIEEVRVGDLADKVEWRWKQRNAVRHCTAHADIDT